MMKDMSSLPWGVPTALAPLVVSMNDWSRRRSRSNRGDGEPVGSGSQRDAGNGRLNPVLGIAVEKATNRREGRLRGRRVTRGHDRSAIPVDHARTDLPGRGRRVLGVSHLVIREYTGDGPGLALGYDEIVVYQRQLDGQTRSLC